MCLNKIKVSMYTLQYALAHLDLKTLWEKYK